MPETGLQIHVRTLTSRVTPEVAYSALFSGQTPSFWLDSSLVAEGLSRFSFMGDARGPHAEYVRYRASEHRVVVERGDEVVEEQIAFLDYLERELARRSLTSGDLPFDFNLGYVGFLGYEMKADCGASEAHAAPTPDAAFVFCDRMLAFDHRDGQVYLLALSTGDSEPAALAWLAATSRALGALELSPEGADPPPEPIECPSVGFRHALPEYERLVEHCQSEIAAGETYEVCLTNMLSIGDEIDPFSTYRALRSSCPAPYSAYLQFPDMHVLSSSPERFLRIDRARRAESRPIKGTRRRGSTTSEDRAMKTELATSEKERAENMMIVDLMRNDLSRVCEIGSVRVSKLFEIESYATVHQMVSTISGTLRPEESAVTCVRAAFPPGSMTGAPKLRAMEIIDRLEQGARGVYSGALGYFALSGGADLSVVIRSIVTASGAASIGVGGAVTALSDPRREVEETLVKARGALGALVHVSRAEERAVGVS
ncbi:MAG: aminodeoxychorismate synthase component I [Gaiellaceae bacterium]